MTGPDILFADQRFVVLNKPAGLPVHAGPRSRASVEDWFATLTRRKDGPWLAHRLDADTAGCLVVALRKAALVEAQAAFAAGRAEKLYWAIVRGEPAAGSGTVDLPLRKHSDASGWRVVPDPSGQSAMTDWRVLGRGGGRSWLELKPRTGRTHQVRVHCASLGTPVIGDGIYGDTAGQLHLLARSIRLPLSPELAAWAPPPPHMTEALAECGADA